jgi:hypothetical protein
MSGSNVLIGRFVLCTVMLVPAVAGAQQNSSETTRTVTNLVVPAYPELARTMNVRGIVRLDVLVAPNGTVKSVKVIGDTLCSCRQPSGRRRNGNGNPRCMRATKQSN